MTTATFLGLPVEVRLVIYDAYLTGHLQVHDEALPILSQFVSLSNELEINAFILNTSNAVASRVLWADVANDARVVTPSGSARQEGAIKPAPLSHLHLALRRMTSLQRLRVFQCHRGLPITILGSGAARLALEFELAMYPSGTAPPLSAYEIYVDAETRVKAFQVISPRSLVRLRLSGEVRFPTPMATAALRQITLHSITGNHFDRSHLEETFSGGYFEIFAYAQGDRLGFNLMDHHLESVIALSRSSLRTLVLLRCSRLSSATIAMCLEQLPLLEMFALSFVGVREPDTDFLRYLPPNVSVLKLHITSAFYAHPHLEDHRNQWRWTFGNNYSTRVGGGDRLLALAQLHGIQMCMGFWDSELERAL
ncbi:hypothetical protein C8Q72DRAFT_949006 [Fomitopsis betulina]|nr:hypothetical protein C8Q72DRAFT_949006 [Fomitopsis betulina]